jgi:hypothetical protein
MLLACVIPYFCVLITGINLGKDAKKLSFEKESLVPIVFHPVLWVMHKKEQAPG